MPEHPPSAAPDGLVIEAVEWLPSGGHSGLVRVRGRWRGRGAPEEVPLPDLLVEAGGALVRQKSLPDPRAGREPSAWRGAYVVSADAVAEGRVALEFPGGVRVPLPPLAVAVADEPVRSGPVGPGGEVVDRAVLADRRARRAEAAEQAQARIAREALKAVEVLELRGATLEEQLEALRAERDALLRGASRASGVPEAEVQELRRRLAEAAAAEAALRSQLEAAVARAHEPAGDEAAARAEAERRAARLREALTSAVATVGSLRLQLHEERVRSRTAEITHAAEGVRLAVLASERIALAAELDVLRRRIRDAEERENAGRAQLEGLQARTAGAEAAVAETRRQLTETVAELRRARERIGELEAQLAASEAEARRIAQEEVATAVQAALAERERELLARHEAAEEEFASRQEEARAALAAAREELARAEVARARAETERALAEAEAAAALGRQRAADVARAALAQQLADERVVIEAQALELARRPQPGAQPAAPLAAADDLRARAAEQEEAAAPPAGEAPDVPEREQLLADLDAAAQALRARAAAPEPAADAAPEPAADAAPRAAIVSAAEPARRLATGREARAYPVLRGAIVKLAHDDPHAAGRLIAGLLPAQWRIVDQPVDYDLTIAEVGTFAVTVTAGAARVRDVPAPRGRAQADFHLRADALTLAEMLAGVGPRPRRFGPARVTGRARRAKVLRSIPSAELDLATVVRAGARLEPELVLRALAYAVRPAWTRGHDFAVAHELAGADGTRTVYVGARDGRGLEVSEQRPPRGSQATVTLSPSAFEALLRGDDPPPGEEPSTRGDERAVETLWAWAERVRRPE